MQYHRNLQTYSRLGKRCLSMKSIASFFAVAVLALTYSGCAAKATMGNQDQHGAAVSAKTKGTEKGIHAKVY